MPSNDLLCVCVLTLAAHWAPSGPVAWSQGHVQLSGNIISVCLCLSLCLSISISVCPSLSFSLLQHSNSNRPLPAPAPGGPFRPDVALIGGDKARGRLTAVDLQTGQMHTEQSESILRACMGAGELRDSPFCGAHSHTWLFQPSAPTPWRVNKSSSIATRFPRRNPRA